APSSSSPSNSPSSSAVVSWYLPREFGQVFMTYVYVHPKVNAGDACGATTIADCVHRLQTLSPTAPNIVLGDLNHCDLKRVLPDFEQHYKK
ncbi:hypothetical protein BaRGS_00030687, partial [Batillaria attramentaria]